ncbi:Transglutaminase-like superfamily protein [Aquisphaera giovannonii]|uniref:Transglutaminase-like superfamily protein n=1 Tax=Aquisphaera giovannonii TaxID=406548 RepID=A0A5B9VZX8_9BACT|nr:transglutaminase domain-containing protein [Aquisphaera giovannonii]QEH33537.1 Transglutaminase-like superfamily protein [Aquisphaera giovannonii]
MLAPLFVSLSLLATVDGAEARPWWGPDVAASLARCPERRADWERMLADVPPERRPGAAYLMRDLPLSDLKELPAAELSRNLDLAYRARDSVAWGGRIPEEIFLDAVLPFASVTERRQPIRAEWLAEYLPAVKACRSPGEAAQVLNRRLFGDTKVRYNTRRIRPDQSSRESIAQGMATCTGLSIMLVEACRAVGVPARLAGIASWPGRGGNHTWVEVWDGGWHFVGAAEPDDKGLDHAWFADEAGGAIRDKPQNAIFAVTYRRTGDYFPMAWEPAARVNAENVTERYRRPAAIASPKPAGKASVAIDVVKGGHRVAAEVEMIDEQTARSVCTGTSLGAEVDINRRLSAEVPTGRDVVITARHGGLGTFAIATVGEDQVLALHLDREPTPPSREKLAGLLSDRFGTDGARREHAERLLTMIPFHDSQRAAAWDAYRSSPIHAELKREFEARRVTTPHRTSPYLWRHVGRKPDKGWALVIAMHGGGGAPKEVNDSQWKGMFERYYKEHPEAGGYVYLALRAPNDEWNGFYDDLIVPIVERLILQFVLFGEVDPDRVSILGASHGGYGAFVIGPKAPDRFSAIHASASAPTDGETMGENLRDTRFTFMVGSKDTAHGRADRCQAFARQREIWKEKWGGYEGGFEWKPDVGHSVPDRDKVAELLRAPARDAWPDRVVWVQSDDVIKRFYWLDSPEPADGTRIEAVVKHNAIEITSSRATPLFVWLDAPLVDLNKAVSVRLNGVAPRVLSPSPELETFCRGIEQRGDPHLAAPVRIEIKP